MAEPATPEAAPAASLADAAGAQDGPALVVPTFASLGDFEAFLRRTGGYSRRAATALVSEAKAVVLRQVVTERDQAALLAALRARAELLRPDSAEPDAEA